MAVWVPGYLDGWFLFILESFVGKLQCFPQEAFDPHNIPTTALVGTFFSLQNLAPKNILFTGTLQGLFLCAGCTFPKSVAGLGQMDLFFDLSEPKRLEALMGTLAAWIHVSVCRLAGSECCDPLFLAGCASCSNLAK